MTRTILVACAGLLMLSDGAALAQQAPPTWIGVVDITKDAPPTKCGSEKGSKLVVIYRPFLTAGDPPSALLLEEGSGGATFMVNKDATSQFQGTGSVLATLISTGPLQVVQKVNGNYDITLDPPAITADTQTIQISSATVNLKKSGVGSCVYVFRGILTPGSPQN